MKKIIEVLEQSVKKNGIVPLTNQHLLNILKLAEKIETDEEDKLAIRLDEARMQIYADQCGDRD